MLHMVLLAFYFGVEGKRYNFWNSDLRCGLCSAFRSLGVS